jgi:hypothetical protein
MDYAMSRDMLCTPALAMCFQSSQLCHSGIFGVIGDCTQFGAGVRMNSYFLDFHRAEENTWSATPAPKPMRFFVLSVSADEGLSPIRNTVLAHAGYAVIPVPSAAKAVEVLSSRHVSVLVIGHSISLAERNRLCSEAQKRSIPALVLSQFESHRNGSPFQVYINPLDGPEVLLEAISNLLKTVQ